MKEKGVIIIHQGDFMEPCPEDMVELGVDVAGSSSSE